jgi:hypothetical protein
MNFVRAVSVGATCFAALPAILARGEPECRNLIVQMSNNAGTASVFKNPGDFAGEGTAIFMCNGSKLEIRDQVSIHMINSTDYGLCYSDFSCGNVELWAGCFEVGAQTLSLTFGEFVNSGAWRTLPLDTPQISVSVSTDYLQASRHCTRLSEPICVGGK